MQFKKSLLLSFLLIIVSPILFASIKFGTYTYNLETVFSILEVSLIEDGIPPNTEEFKTTIENLKIMIDAFGEEEFVSNIKKNSPFTCIEIDEDVLRLKLHEGKLEIPIEIIQNHIYSKDPDTMDLSLGYFDNNKFYFNFTVTFYNDEQITISNDLKDFYLIPFEKDN